MSIVFWFDLKHKVADVCSRANTGLWTMAGVVCVEAAARRHTAKLQSWRLLAFFTAVLWFGRFFGTGHI